MSEWQTGQPSTSRYYLITWSNDADGHRIVSEAWFNSSTKTWWFSRGYIESREKSDSVAALELRRVHPDLPIPHIHAWMPLPNPSPSPATPGKVEP